MPPPDLAEIHALVGHEFPGGGYTIEHWENFLLTECTGAELLPDGIVHPAALFHVPIQGVGITLAELFALGQADDDGSISIESYDWELIEPLQEDVTYTCRGGIVEADRRESERGNVYDRIAFRIEMLRPGGEVAARITNTWHYRRRT